MDNFTVLSIPEISNERQIWLIRTNGGLYYNDFTTNKIITPSNNPIITLVTFSTPRCNPTAQIPQPIITINIIQKTLAAGSACKVVKTLPTSFGDKPIKSPFNIFTK